MDRGTFSGKSDNGVNGLRGASAYRINPEWEVSRRIGGGKSADIPAPETETDRALDRSREALTRLRQMLADQ